MNDNVLISQHDDDLAHLLDRPWPDGISDRARYDHALSQWRVWDGMRWKPDAIGTVYEMVRSCLSLWLADTRETDKAKKLLPLLNQSKKKSVLEALSSFKNIAMTGDEWDPDPGLLTCANGVLDLRTLEFDTTPDPGLLLSKSTNVTWDPEATCPKFTKFISEVTGDDTELSAYLMHVLGYAMFGWQREQKFWLWVGEGSNGKGTLAKVVATVLGEYADSPAPELYMKTRFGSARADSARPELVKLQGIRWSWMSEPHGGKFNDEMVKAHTGDDPIQARPLYKNTFHTFRPSHTIIFLTNDAPKIEDVGLSMRRRVRVIKFLQSFSDPGIIDHKLEERLREEASGILTLLAAYAHDWFINGLTEPQSVLDWSNEYIEDNDPLVQFVVDYLAIEASATLSARAAFDTYTDWCARTDQDPMSQTAFGLALGRKFRKTKTRTGTVYNGVREKSAWELTESRFG